MSAFHHGTDSAGHHVSTIGYPLSAALTYRERDGMLSWNIPKLRSIVIESGVPTILTDQTALADIVVKISQFYARKAASCVCLSCTEMQTPKRFATAHPIFVHEMPDGTTEDCPASEVWGTLDSKLNTWI